MSCASQLPTSGCICCALYASAAHTNQMHFIAASYASGWMQVNVADACQSRATCLTMPQINC